MLEVSVDGDPTDVLAALAELGEPMQTGSTVALPSGEAPETLSARVNALGPSTLGVRSTTVRPTTLNDVFLVLTARRSAVDGVLVGAGS
jgi:hypothetical protein